MFRFQCMPLLNPFDFYWPNDNNNNNNVYDEHAQKK